MSEIIYKWTASLDVDLGYQVYSGKDSVASLSCCKGYATHQWSFPLRLPKRLTDDKLNRFTQTGGLILVVHSCLTLETESQMIMNQKGCFVCRLQWAFSAKGARPYISSRIQNTVAFSTIRVARNTRLFALHHAMRQACFTLRH